MQKLTTIARPYAQAVFEQAQEEGNLAAWSNMLDIINMVMSESQMRIVLENTTSNADYHVNFILDICGNYLSDTGKNFVKVLAQAERLNLTPQIYKLFEQSRSDAKGTIEVQVTSAYPLERSEKDKISDAMSKRFGKKITISTQVDKSLIGGSIIRAGDSVIDASVKGRLKQLENELVE